MFYDWFGPVILRIMNAAEQIEGNAFLPSLGKVLERDLLRPKLNGEKGLNMYFLCLKQIPVTLGLSALRMGVQYLRKPLVTMIFYLSGVE